MENEIGFALYMLGVLLLLGLSVWVYGWYKSNIESERATETLKNLKDIFWDYTPIGWTCKGIISVIKFFVGVQPKMAAKHAPLTYNPPPPPARRSSLHIPTPPPISSYNTSSLNMGNKIGKPLVIKNWDRLAGMVIPMLVNTNFGGHNWIVTRAGQITDGYECMIENSGGFGTSNRAVTLTVYSDMYDSHRVLVKCGGRISTMDIDVFKDPNNMLYRIANEFQEKFR
jgi:hypothetical protein